MVVLFIFLEIDEVVCICLWVFVLRDRRLSGHAAGSGLSVENLMRLMAGTHDTA